MAVTMASGYSMAARALRPIIELEADEVADRIISGSSDPGLA
jgi:hypothetical protein